MKHALAMAGAVAALLALVPAIDAVGALRSARDARDAAAADLVADAAAPPATLAAAFPADDAADARRRLAARLRRAAAGGGVLIESMRGDDAVSPGLATLTIGASGPEKAVLAFVDTLERDAMPVRFRTWRLAPTAGGVRLDGQAVAPWRG